MAWSQPIFAVRGTQLKPYYSRGLGTNTQYKLNLNGINAAVNANATAGVFGGSVIHFCNGSQPSAQLYAGFQNWSATGIVSLLFRIVPNWTGNPVAKQTLINAANAIEGNCGLGLIINTNGTLYINFTTIFAADNFANSTIPLSFTSGTPTDILLEWGGANNAKIYQSIGNGGTWSLVESVTLNGTAGVWDQNQIASLVIGTSNAGNYTAVGAANYDLNEFCLFESLQTPSGAGRSGFITTPNANGDTVVDPGIANVLSPAAGGPASYQLGTTTLVGTYVPTTRSTPFIG